MMELKKVSEAPISAQRNWYVGRCGDKMLCGNIVIIESGNTARIRWIVGAILSLMRVERVPAVISISYQYH